MQNSDEGFNEYATEDDREYLRNLMNESERLRENDDYDDDYDYDDAHRNIVRQGLRSSDGNNNNNNNNNSADNEHIDDDDDDDRDDGFEEELSFAEVFRRVKERKLLATSAAKRFERICLIRADDLRAKIHRRNSDRTKQQHRVMRKVVVELEREAKTWNLVNHLFGDAMYEDRRAFEEDRVRCLASKRTMNGYEGDVMIPCLSVRERLIVRDEKRDPVLFRAQRILAWLEENQAQKLKREMFSSSNNNVTANKTASNTGTNFIDANCGTFKETALAVEQGSTQDYEGRELSERLDMDGVVVGNNSMITSDINNDYYYYSKSNNDNNNNNRNINGSHGGSGKKGALHPVDAMNETKLLKKLWQILRSGNIEQARDLCIKCGQPWRAASLGGASGWSFVPVGENCERERLRDDARVHAVLRREERGLNKNGSFDEIPLHVQNELDAVDERVISECLMMKSKKKSGNNANNIDDDEENSGLVDHRRLWKWTLHKASRQLLSKLEDDTSYNNGGGDDALTRTERERLVYEAAIYASLCGDVDGMMHAAVAESDDDVLGSEISYTNGDSYDAIAWVLFRSIIDHCIDKKLMKKWDESVIGEYVDDFVNNNDCDGDDDDGINRATQCADFWASGFDVGKPIREDAGDDDDDDDHDDGDDAEFNNNDNSNNNNAHVFDDYGPRWPTQEVLESCPTNPQAAFEVLEKLQSREGFETHRTIQKDLALGSIENIIKNVLCERIFSSAAVAAGRDDESTPRTFQRFAANFVLSLKDVLHAENDIERKEIEEKGDFFASRGLDYECDKIVGKYVITLISEQRYSLVSLYASQLNAHSRADILSKFYCIKSSSMSPKAKLKRHEECMEWIPLEGEGNRRDIVRKTLERSRFEEFSHVEAKWLNEVSQWATRDVNKDFAKEARSFACKLLRERALRRTFRAVEQTFIDANEGDNSFAQIGNDEYFNGESDALDLINSELKTFLLDPATIDFDNHEQQQQQQEEDEEDSYDSKNTRELIKWSKYFECCEMLKKWRATAKRNFVPPEEEVLYEVDGGGGEFNNINKAKRKERELRQRPFHDEEKRESDSALALKCVDKVFNLFNSPQRSFIWLHDKDDVDILLNDDDDNNDNENKEDFFWFRLTTDVYGFDEVEQELIAEKTDSFSEALREALTEENIKEEQIEEYSVQCEAKGEETIGIRAFLKLRYFQNMSNNNNKKENKDKNDVKMRTMRALSKVIKALYLDVNQFETSEDDDDHNGNSSSFFASKRLCEFVCVPSLLIQAAECEAWILTTTTTTTESAANNRITKLVADLYAETLFTNDELRRVLNFRALGAMREENNT